MLADAAERCAKLLRQILRTRCSRLEDYEDLNAKRRRKPDGAGALSLYLRRTVVCNDGQETLANRAKEQ